jgi:hypothetical protein
MTQESYRRALDEAIIEYEQLGAQRALIDERLAHLTQTIGMLSKLCNLVPTVSLGLTDACRMALKTAGHPLTVNEVRMQLEAMGTNLSHYSNPLAAIHTVLKRLRQSGEARFVPRAHAKPMYAWKRPVKIVALPRTWDKRRLAQRFAAGVLPTSERE